MPPSSTDSNPLDYSIWPLLDADAQAKKAETRDELEDHVAQAVGNLRRDVAR